MPLLAAGVVMLPNDVGPRKGELSERPDQAQSPETRFFSCSDPRSETAMIDKADPGELFNSRNAGNIATPPAARWTRMSMGPRAFRPMNKDRRADQMARRTADDRAV